ncbi:hypothetical protein GIB67_033347 [Kingdonia uniflora]|uniref:Non-haem dioxygenase N-terminal domain-containing protein n=1 Tax=Kingdonia uniflora TaxID=39325 RepID=A0A7J7L8J0_9MAGN|nr:hypothetical protein GIB67_023080 [Kingdonia uniflora]KAF6145988.1 hypothetical protein GIB67_033347 [Kingdonia uniflora]
MAPTMSELWDIMDFVVRKGNGVKGLSETGLETVPKQYVQLMEESGEVGFQVINHGVPIEFLDKVEEATRQLFRLPAEAKMKYTKSISNRRVCC